MEKGSRPNLKVAVKKMALEDRSIVSILVIRDIIVSQ